MYCLHLQGRKISQGSIQLAGCCFLGFLFDPEDGHSAFSRSDWMIVNNELQRMWKEVVVA
jgi:hypothetical protein